MGSGIATLLLEGQEKFAQRCFELEAILSGLAPLFPGRAGKFLLFSVTSFEALM